jgi:hypothetical protein
MHLLDTVRSIRQQPVRATMAALAMSLLTLPAAAQTRGDCQPHWVSTFGEAPGTDDIIEAMAVFDDGSGEALYVGGEFSRAGGASVNGLAKWDGTQWSDVGGGVNGTVRAIAVFDDGSGPALYIGGSFQTAGNETIEALAKWDGSTWSHVGNAFVNGGFVWSLAVFDAGNGPALYVGGFFTEVGGSVPANRIARWDGTSWSALGGGMTSGPGGQVRALQVFDDGLGGGPQLYAAGSFLEADGATVNRIARWDHVTGTWSGLGDGFNTHVWDLEIYDDGLGGGPALHACGEFSFSGAAPVSRIAKWDPATSSWTAPGGGVTGTGTVVVRSMVVYDDGAGAALHVGGQFTAAGGVPATSFAKWDGSAWSALGVGMNGLVTTLTIYDDGTGDAIFAGGSYIGLGLGLIVDRLLKWDGQTWYPVGHGLTASVRALEVLDDGNGAALYAGGLFVSGDGEPLLRIARWNGGTSWTGLGGGVTGGTTINDLAVFDDGSGGGPALYAVGDFSTIGGLSIRRIAKWNASGTWSELAGGLSSTAHALEVFDDGTGPALYVAGQFTTTFNGLTVNRIAKWDGKAWSALGDGLSQTATDLIVHDDGSGGGTALYVGGGFTTAGGLTVNRVAKWDGTNWSSLGDPVPGVPALVTSFGVYDDGSGDGEALYVSFDAESTSNGVVVNRIAKWDGAEWSPLGDGLNHTAGAMQVYNEGTGDGPVLIVGGAFTAAGGQPVDYIAKWNGATWQPLAGGGMQNIVSAIQLFDDGLEDGQSLFVGGSFIDSPAGDSYLAKWTGCAEAPPCPADFVTSATFQPPADGIVDAADLAYLLGEWGRNPGSLADIVTSATFAPPPDGVVDAADLAYLLGAWGACRD